MKTTRNILRVILKLTALTIGVLAFFVFAGVAEATSFEDFALRIGYGVIFSAVAFVLNTVAKF